MNNNSIGNFSLNAVKQEKGVVLTGYVKSNNRLMRNLLKQTNASCCITYELLLSHRNSKTHECFPTIELLAKEANFTKVTILSCIKTLRQLGVITAAQKSPKSATRYFFPYEEDYSKEKETKIRNELKNNILSKENNASKIDTIDNVEW